MHINRNTETPITDIPMYNQLLSCCKTTSWKTVSRRFQYPQGSGDDLSCLLGWEVDPEATVCFVCFIKQPNQVQIWLGNCSGKWLGWFGLQNESPNRPIFPSLVFHIIRTSQAIAPFMARYGQANSVCVCVCFIYRQMVLPWDADDLWRTPCHYRSLQKRTTMGRLWVASPNKNPKGFSELMHLVPCFHAWKCIHLVHLSIKWYHYFRWFWFCHDAKIPKPSKGYRGPSSKLEWTSWTSHDHKKG